MEGLECKEQDLIVNTEVDWKPMKLFEHRSDMVCGWSSGNDVCSRILDQLQFIEGFL